MKKTNIKTWIMFACMTFGFAQLANAQFYSSETVYCYRYVKTVNDGISSKMNRIMFYFVNFQNGMMGFVVESNLQRVKQNLLEDPNYYSDRAIQNLANSYNNWKTQPEFFGSALKSASINKYCDEFSTSSKYTYRIQQKHAESNIMAGQAWWGKAQWGTKCYSFSYDKSELIIWSTSDPDNRDYYELVDVNTLKPNIDFLD